MCLGRKVVVAMLDWSRERPDYQRYAALFLLAYTFLLRVPSEAIPTVAGGVADQSSQAILALEGDALHWRLRRRKNKPQGSSLRRHLVRDVPQVLSSACVSQVAGRLRPGGGTIQGHLGTGRVPGFETHAVQRGYQRCGGISAT